MRLAKEVEEMKKDKASEAAVAVGDEVWCEG